MGDSRRANVYLLIDGEREYQDALPATRTIQPATKEMALSEHYAMFRHYLGVAFTQWTLNPGDEQSLDVIRKLAGICVRAMEQHGYMPFDDSFGGLGCRKCPPVRRVDIYAVIDRQAVLMQRDREYVRNPQKHQPVAQWLVSIEAVAARFAEAILQNDELDALRQLRRIAALCVLCMDEHGAPPRKAAA